ncbi:tyrosine-type recombinase/integrase [Nonomuraea cypriaca]|uniref:tyrosine-type recombinase/integrase n=1 Tax=Nonomuraea cypriaca TaxID=1187855 RepID=UPI001A9CB78F|nr:site-specific integrase [Nonomuraea cypriaca]
MDRRRDFPRRLPRACWAQSLATAQEVIARIDAPPFRPDNGSGYRRHGAARVLEWLASHPGDSWQERWLASAAEDLPKETWVDAAMAWRAATGRSSAPSNRDSLQTGLLMLVLADVVRPSLTWMVPRSSSGIVRAMEQCRDPEGYAALRAMIAADPDGITAGQARLALGRITMILACKGGQVRDITVGDYLDLLEAMRETNTGGAGRILAYRLLHTLGHLGPDAPTTGRAFLQAAGQRTAEELVDRYQVRCRPVRDLLVEYLRERQPALDYTTLAKLANDLVRLFWVDLERHHPGIDTLQLTPETATAWRQRVSFRTKTVIDPDGRRSEQVLARADARSVMMAVRAFYLDLAQWALDEPHRWAQWAVPCPIKETDCNRAKEDKLVKARMDQRTRERLPALPKLADAVNQHRQDAAALLQAARDTRLDASFTFAGRTWHRLSTTAYAGSIWIQPADADPTTRLDAVKHDADAFWAWAFVEVLRHTGIRFEELRELSHHSITSYRLPTTGELVPLLQIAPSKTGSERLLLVDPELADVLSAIVTRIRDTTGAVPLVTSYDTHEKIWNPPMSLLFQRTIAGERRPISDGSLREIFQQALAGSGIRGTDGQPLIFTPHDFRRIFVTDAVMNGLPPHIAQIICGHRDINTTMGYKAIYPAEAIEAHRAFIARRRAARPSQEYRTPTDAEWDEFLTHFEKRKLSIGTCARAFATPCIHEHACIRCPMLRPDPAQLTRLQEIHDNLLARIAEAEHQGWLGEIEGLTISLAGAREKLRHLNQQQRAITLGMPTYRDTTARNSTVTR